MVTYDQEPHDTALVDDHPDAYPAAGHMPAETEKGDLEDRLAASAFVVDARYTTPKSSTA